MKKKAKKALKSILNQCTYVTKLLPLIDIAPDDILVYILQQFAKTLPKDPVAKKYFVIYHLIRLFAEQGLKSIQNKPTIADSKLKIHIDDINSLYPQEIVQFYSPDYADALMKKLDNHQYD